MHISTLSYTTANGEIMQSRLYLPAHAPAKHAAVLVFPEWWGMSAHVLNSAERIAQAGYAALAVDLYGKGLLTDEAAVANEHMSALLDNPAVLNERMDLAHAALCSVPAVDKERVAAAGFCFGGKVALDFARRSSELKAAVSFHGNLSPAAPAEKGKVRAAFLVQHGAADSMIGMDSVDAFRAEMQAAQATHRIDVFPDAKHGFTNPQADVNAKRNGVDLGYHHEASETAWQNMFDWLAAYL